MKAQFAFVLLCACACAAPPQPSNDAGGNKAFLLDPPVNTAINFVGRKAVPGGFEVGTGGLVRGGRRYRVDRWVESAPYRFGGGTLTLLWSADDRGLSTSGVLGDSAEVRAALETQLVKQFDALDQLRGQETQRPIVKFRLVPMDVAFEHLTKTNVSANEKAPLDLVVIAPSPGDSLKAWTRTLAGTALHEYVHMLQWDFAPGRYEDQYEREAQAYGVQICAAYLAANVVPEVVYQFPGELEEAASDYKDVPIAEVVSQLREQKEPATLVGVGAARLAFHRFFTEVKAAGTGAPTIDQALPFCRAMARGELVWTDKDVDARISEFAKAAGKRP